jgi:hypothetical protein
VRLSIRRAAAASSRAMIVASLLARLNQDGVDVRNTRSPFVPDIGRELLAVYW